MERFIARENIKRFEAQLANCADPEQRAVLKELLERERRLLMESTVADELGNSSVSGKARSQPPARS